MIKEVNFSTKDNKVKHSIQSQVKLVVGANCVGKSEILNLIYEAIDISSPMVDFSERINESVFFGTKSDIWTNALIVQDGREVKAVFIDSNTNFTHLIYEKISQLDDTELLALKDMFNKFHQQIGGFYIGDNVKFSLFKDGLSVHVSDLNYSIQKLLYIIACLVDRDCVVIVDDIDVHLHINVQIKLSSVIAELADNFRSPKEVFLIASTHSPAMTMNTANPILNIERIL